MDIERREGHRSDASEYGIHPAQVSTWKSAALKGLPDVFEKADTDQRAEKEEHVKQLQELHAQIGRLTTQVAWLKHLASNLSREQRLALIERTESALPLSVQADLLSVSRAHLYYQSSAPSAEEIALKNRIDEIYTAYPFYGSRRITAVSLARFFHAETASIQSILTYCAD